MVAPEVPFTVMVYVPFGVPGLPLLEPPPQEASHTVEIPSTTMNPMNLIALKEGFRDAVSTKPIIPGNSMAYKIPVPRSSGARNCAVGAAVVIWKLTCPAALAGGGTVQTEAVAGSSQVNVTVPLKLPPKVRLTVASMEDPWVTWKLAAVGARVNPPDDADQARARCCRFTEPKPVTRLKPVTASPVEASNPSTPLAGHCRATGWFEGVFGWQYTLLSPLVIGLKAPLDGVPATEYSVGFTLPSPDEAKY